MSLSSFHCIIFNRNKWVVCSSQSSCWVITSAAVLCKYSCWSLNRVSGDISLHLHLLTSTHSFISSESNSELWAPDVLCDSDVTVVIRLCFVSTELYQQLLDFNMFVCDSAAHLVKFSPQQNGLDFVCFSFLLLQEIPTALVHFLLSSKSSDIMIVTESWQQQQEPVCVY